MRASSTWMSRTYKSMVVHGGVAFSHFSTTLKSKQTWHLGLATKQSAFTALNKSAPTQR